MTPMTEARLANIGARAERATVAPWSVHAFSVRSEDRSLRAACFVHEDAAFIAHARTDIPDLLDEVRHQRAGNERLREALGRIKRIAASADAMSADADISLCERLAEAALSATPAPALAEAEMRVVEAAMRMYRAEDAPPGTRGGVQTLRDARRDYIDACAALRAQQEGRSDG